MSIDSEHVNYLVYRYLQESGFQHSSFVFAHESGVTKTSVAGTKIPPGALVTHLQRALNYIQAEIALFDEENPATADELEFVDSLTLIESVQPEVGEQRRALLRERRAATMKNELKATIKNENGVNGIQEIGIDNVKIVRGHEKEVFACAWNPCRDLLATASGDSTARLWTFEDGVYQKVAVLAHRSADFPEGKEVTSLDWNPIGNLLATGSSDACARIWTDKGDLQMKLSAHTGPIFSVRWNKAGDLLASASVDQSAIVWFADTGDVRQIFRFHTAPCLDVFWRNDTSFTSCSTDGFVYHCQVDEFKPLKVFKGHVADVNCIRWDPSSTYLASCSDDCTVRIWTLESESSVQCFSHNDKVSTLQWCPIQSTTNDAPILLASGSFDFSIRIWDCRDGRCLFTFSHHRAPVYAIDFSSDGRYLASGSFDCIMAVWSMENGKLAQSFAGDAGIFDVKWSKKSEKIAICSADHTVRVASMKL